MEQRISIFGYSDEIIAVIALPIIVLNLAAANGTKIKINKDSYWFGILVMIFSGLLGNVIYCYQPFVKAALPDLFLCIKFWFWIELGTYIYRGFNYDRYAKKIFNHARVITWFYFGMTLLDNALHIFPTDIRYGFRSTKLFYFHPTSFASCVILLMAILLIIKKWTENTKFYFYEIILSVLACTSMRSKIFGSVMLFWLIVYFILIRKKKITVWTLLMFIPPVLLIGWNQVQFYFMSDMIQGSPRYQLLTKSLLILRDHMPIGSGFATFASHYSGVVYSPLYSIYGISNVYGISASNISYISDSFWPMIFGQTGLIGTIGFIYALYKIYKCVQKARKGYREIYAAGIFVLAYLLVESTSSAAFTHPIYMPMAFAIALVLNCTYMNQYNLRRSK